MKIREWLADNIGYRFSGCLYAKSHDHIFDYISSVIPNEFTGKEISDLGCGDGTNTLRLKEIFKPKSITGYERNEYLIKKAKEKGLKVKRTDLNKEISRGELAAFTFSLHHIADKEKCLRSIKRNFKYIFLIEPCNGLYHKLLDAGDPLSKEDWRKLFDKVFGKYKSYQYKNNILVFYTK